MKTIIINQLKLEKRQIIRFNLKYIIQIILIRKKN